MAGDLYAPLFFEEFGFQQLAVHSLNSFIVRRAQEAKIIFGECYHIGEAVSVGIEVSKLNLSRILYIEVDAEAIAPPPGLAFDPFFEQVKVPVAAIEDIRAA